MEFYLTRDVEVIFYNNGNSSTSYWSSCIPVNVALEPRGEMEEHIRNIYLTKMRSVLDSESTNQVNGINEGVSDVIHLRVRMIPEKRTAEEGEAKTKKFEMDISCCSIGLRTFLERVFNSFKFVSNGSEIPSYCNAAIRLNVALPGTTNDGSFICTAASEIKNYTTKNTRTPYFGTYAYNNTVSEEIARCWNTGSKQFTGRFTVTLLLYDAAVNRLFLQNHSPSGVLTFFRDMLDNGMEADTEIMPGGDGATPVKCHRAILASRSSVFRELFQSGMMEATNNQIKTPEMSERSVKAFIKYLYTFNVESPLQDWYLALELLKAGNKYDVADLRTAMYELLMMKPNDWFNVEAALDLLAYTKELISDTAVAVVNAAQNKKMKLDFPEGTMWNDLNLKAVKVLSWYAKEKPMYLMTSEHFKRLHMETPQLAMELHVNFIKCVDLNKWRNH